jgi:hypothetical protein
VYEAAAVRRILGHPARRRGPFVAQECSSSRPAGDPSQAARAGRRRCRYFIHRRRHPVEAKDPTMKTIAARLTIATLLVAAAAAGVLALAPHAAAPQMEVVVLPAVEVTGHRLQFVQLPTVTVIAKREAPQTTLVAQKAARADAL